MCLDIVLACIYIYICVYHVCAWCPTRLEEIIRSSGLELQTVVSQHVGTGTQTWFLWKNSQCPQPLDRLSSPSAWPYTVHLCVFQAGATSMWASCCGLLNEVMGTGAVRGQQAGFPGSSGPFRFTPSSDFPTFPPAATAGPNIVCKACGLSFSVFRKKVSLKLLHTNSPWGGKRHGS